MLAAADGQDAQSKDSASSVLATPPGKEALEFNLDTSMLEEITHSMKEAFESNLNASQQEETTNSQVVKDMKAANENESANEQAAAGGGKTDFFTDNCGFSLEGRGGDIFFC